MSETLRLGSKRQPRQAPLIAFILIVILLLLAAIIPAVWPKSPSRYQARLAAMEWIRDPNGSGSLLAVCIRSTRRDGGQVGLNDCYLSINSPAVLKSTNFRRLHRPSQQNFRYQDDILLFRQTAAIPPETSLNAHLNERTPMHPWLAGLFRGPGRPPESVLQQQVVGLPALIPPQPPRARQRDLTDFIVARNRQRL